MTGEWEQLGNNGTLRPMIASESEPDGGWRRLDPRFVTMARQSAMLEVSLWLAGSAVVIGLLWWLLDWSLRTKFVIASGWFLLQLTGFLLRWIRAPLHYRHASWRLGDRGLEIRGGAWWRHAVRVPLSRIQHTDVSQGPLERRHGLGTLVAYTAGTNHSAIELGGVAYEDALAVRDQLLRGNATDSV